MKTKFIYSLLFLLIIITAIGISHINNKETVAIIGAMDVEIAEILNNLSNVNSYQQNDFKITTGNIGKYKIVLSKSGVGKVASATTTQFIIDKYKPKYIINTGIAGSLSTDLSAGTTIIADKMIQHDFDITAFGYPKGYMNSGINSDKPTIYYSDKNLINIFTNKYKSLKIKTIATGDIFVKDIKLKHNIKKEFNADVADMESASIAQTAKRNNTPVIILRTISDEVKGTTKEYKQNKQNTAKIPALMIVEILKSNK